MKILLIQPSQYAAGGRESTKSRGWTLTRPFSLFFLASAIRQKTPFEVSVLDLELPKHGGVDFDLAKSVAGIAPDIVGFTGTTMTRFAAIDTIRTVRKALPGAFLVAGGVHFGVTDLDTMTHVPELDAVVRGEGEVPLVELSRAIGDRRQLDGVPGLTWRKEDKIVRNTDSVVFEELDSLDPYEDFSWEDYPEFLMSRESKQVRALSVMSSRGCPYRCAFCSKAGMKYRLRDPRKVVDEIETLKRRFKIDGVNFLDLTLTASASHVRALCQEMIDRRIEVCWWCESRANINIDLFDIMRRAGCVELVMGVESGSPRVLKSISKNISLDQVREAVRRCNQVGIHVTLYFMYSHPGETAADVRLTWAFAEEMRLRGTAIAMQPTLIFPGTGIEDLARSSGLLPENFSWCEPFHDALSDELAGLPQIPLFRDRLEASQLRKPLQWLRDRDYMASLRAEGPAGWLRRSLNGTLRHWRHPSYVLKRFGMFVRSRL